jgi:hypothetical protein
MEGAAEPHPAARVTINDRAPAPEQRGGGSGQWDG